MLQVPIGDYFAESRVSFHLPPTGKDLVAHGSHLSVGSIEGTAVSIDWYSLQPAVTISNSESFGHMPAGGWFLDQIIIEDRHQGGVAPDWSCMLYEPCVFGIERRLRRDGIAMGKSLGPFSHTACKKVVRITKNKREPDTGGLTILQRAEQWSAALQAVWTDVFIAQDYPRRSVPCSEPEFLHASTPGGLIRVDVVAKDDRTVRLLHDPIDHYMITGAPEAEDYEDLVVT